MRVETENVALDEQDGQKEGRGWKIEHRWVAQGATQDRAVSKRTLFHAYHCFVVFH